MMNKEVSYPFSLGKKEARIKHVLEKLSQCSGSYEKNCLLHQLWLTDSDLFYTICRRYIVELLPIIYTPVVGQRVQFFSRDFLVRNASSVLYLNYPDRENLPKMIRALKDQKIKMCVITDGERPLGLEDMGVNGVEIVVAKAALYTLCTGINPEHVLPIVLDAGTNCTSLLEDEKYLGWRHARLEDDEYISWVDDVVHQLRHHFPNMLIHWEDINKSHAMEFISRYSCTFNDDMQGTSVVVASAILVALKAIGQKFVDQNIVIYGFGTAGRGIADFLVWILQKEGLSEKEAYGRIWAIGKYGLVTTKIAKANDPYAKEHIFERNFVSVEDVVQTVHPSVLIGCSGQSQHFSEKLIRNMSQHVERPVILVLSNPIDLMEAHPKDIMEWTEGKALIATGSPINPVSWNNQSYTITQCNNALAFPGLGLGCVAANVKDITNETLWEVCKLLERYGTKQYAKNGAFLPAVEELHDLSLAIAKHLMTQAGVSTDVLEKLCTI